MVGAPSSWNARASVHTTLLSMVPPWSGWGWQMTPKAAGVASSPAGISMSDSSAPAGPASRSRSACGGFTVAWPSGDRARRSREAHQQAIQPPHVIRRVGKRRSLGERRLVVQQLRELVELARARTPVEILHQRVRDVHLEQRARLRDLLAGGREDAPHGLGQIMFPDHQDRGGFFEALAETHLADTLAEGVLDAFQQPLALLELLVALLAVRVVRETPELEVAARRVLEALALVGLDVSHHPFVDAVRKQQHFDAALLEALDRRAGTRRGDALGNDVVDTLLARLHARDIICEAHRRSVTLGGRTGKPQQRQDRQLVG